MSETPSKSLKTPLAVERRDAADLPYETYLSEYVDQNKPVVVRNAAAAWPALRKWTLDFFKEKHGSMLVDVSFTEKMTFSDFVDAVVASTPDQPGPYMFRFFISVHLPELLEDLAPSNPYCFPRRLASPLMPKSWRRPDGYLKLLIGGVGGSFPFMHYDGENMHAAITEIQGDKEFILYAPEDTPYLYPRADLPNQTQIKDLDHPDLEKFPLFERATQYRTVIEPGDTIFVPSRWWHTARVLSPSVSVCTNQVDRSNWDGFVREVCLPHPAHSPVRREIKRAALSVLGPTLGVLETIGKGSGPVGRLAPYSPKEAIPVNEWSKEKWIVRK